MEVITAMGLEVQEGNKVTTDSELMNGRWEQRKKYT